MRVLSTGLILSPSEAESFPEDDIDRLFEKLHKLEPPGDIVKQILARVKRLPVPRPLPQEDSEQFPPNTHQEATE
jgi:hypothetical protein